MSAITLSPQKCVRSLAKMSECSLCEAICPTNAIVIDIEQRISLPSINYSQCVGCGGCVGVCPSEAITLDNFSPTEFFFEFLNENEPLISCQKNVPCVSVLNVEYLVAIASLKKELTLDIGHCTSCTISEKCLPKIEKNAEKANYLLDAMETSAEVKLELVSYTSETQEIAAEDEENRRDFFKAFTLKNAVSVKKNFDREVEIAADELTEHTIESSMISELKRKAIPDKRKLIFTALKRLEKPEIFHVIDANELSFTSQKIMDEESCTACQMCYRICPTAALTSDSRNSKIDFDPFLCIKCHLCHDVCEPNCLTLSSSYNVKEFFEPQVQNLIAFDMRRCNECDQLFSSIGGNKMCRRCEIEEDEAKELWGVKLK
jgi:formate hydrogenlyase subunit 6/NADH:ubiquinone oxidoreductase subunit I